MKDLIVYPNCSKGGVSSVIRGRAVADPDTTIHAVFFNDRGGRDAFADLPNVHVRIVRKDRAKNFLSRLVKVHNYREISILSAPEILEDVADEAHSPISYEFHTSNMTVIENELSKLDPSTLTQIVAPTQVMADNIKRALPSTFRLNVNTRPNLIDTRAFYAAPPTTSHLPQDKKPLLWIGRFDAGKGYRYFLRLLGLLPDEYRGVVIVSLESAPARAAEFLGEAAATGVLDRIDLLANVPQARLGDMYREAAQLGGAMISTSLMESFGYSVAEALACELPVFAFDLPAFHEHNDPKNLMHLVDIGDILELKLALLAE